MGPRGAKGEDPALPGLCGHLAPRALATAGHSAPPNPAASCPSALVEAGGWGHLELGPRARRLGPETPYVASSLTHCVPREEPPSRSEPRVLSRGAGMSCLRPRCSPSPRVCSSSRSGSECSSPAPPPAPSSTDPGGCPSQEDGRGGAKKTARETPEAEFLWFDRPQTWVLQEPGRPPLPTPRPSVRRRPRRGRSSVISGI